MQLLPTPTKRSATLSDSDNSDNETDINEVICSRKKTRPIPLDMKVKRDKFGIFTLGHIMLEEDLALSEDSDDDLEDMAQRIEKEIL
jgi:hypothetical protein